MGDENRLWVLGHKVRLLETEAAYDMIECVSNPGVPGPPPHTHETGCEFFLVVSGRLDCLADGEWRTYEAGSYAEVPPKVVHTFINNSDEDCVWVTGWRPKGFRRFFEDFGIPVSEPNARERSVEGALIERVIRTAGDYGMELAIPDAPPES